MAETTTHNPADMVRSAEFRAKVQAYIHNIEGAISSTDLLDALEPDYTALGLKRPGALYHLNKMAASGQLAVVAGKPHGRKVYGKPGTAPAQQLPQAPTEPTKEPRSAATAGKAKEVELVVAGVTIIVGRNPATGRPRITIES